MSPETIVCGGATAQSLSFRLSLVNLRQFPAHHVSFNLKTFDSPRRLGFCTLAAKRNPKRLKYTSPRITEGDGLVYVEVDPSGSDSWKLEPVVKLLKEGAVGVIPTDTVYAIVCDLKSHSAIERLRSVLEKKLFCMALNFLESRRCSDTFCITMDCAQQIQPLSILCHSFHDIDTYTTGFPRGNDHGLSDIFRLVKHCLPGPYTFILPASKKLPKHCTRYGTATAKYLTRKNVGVRMPDDAICQAILEKLDSPLISTSVKCPKEDEWMIDPVLIADSYQPRGLGFVVDGGVRVADPSTIVDMTGVYPTIIRQGKGPKQDWMIVKEDEYSTTLDEELPIAHAA